MFTKLGILDTIISWSDCWANSQVNIAGPWGIIAIDPKP